MGLGTFKAFRFGGLCWNEFHFLQMLCWNRLAYSVKWNRQSLPATIWYVINLTSQRPKNRFIVVFQPVFQHSILPCARQQRPSRLSRHCNTHSRGRSRGSRNQGTQGSQGSQGRLGRLGSRPTRKCRAHRALPGMLVPLPGGWGMATVMTGGPLKFSMTQRLLRIVLTCFNMFWPHIFARIILQYIIVIVIRSCIIRMAPNHCDSNTVSTRRAPVKTLFYTPRIIRGSELVNNWEACFYNNALNDTIYIYNEIYT